MTREEQARKLLETLHAEGSDVAAGGARLVIEEALARPVRDLVDAETLERILLSAVTTENTARLASRHVRPGLDRARAAFADSGERPADWMNAELRDRLQKLVAEAKPPKMRWARNAVDPVLIRRLFAPVVQDTLTGFARKLPLPGTSAGGAGAGSARLASAASGLRGIGRSLKAQVEKRAEPLLETGRSLLGSMGAEFEAKIQAAAREFSEGAMTGIRDAIRDRLRSEEGRAIEAEIRAQVVTTILDTPLSDLLADVDTLPLDAIDAWIADLAQHAAEGDRLPAILRREIEAWLATEGDRSASELLAEVGIEAQVVDALTDRVVASLASTEPSDAMVAWMASWLEAAQIPA